MVFDGLSGLYGLNYDSTTACGLSLYLCSYKLDGSATMGMTGLPRSLFFSGKVSLVNPSLMLLWDCDHELAQYLNNDGDVGFKL